MIRGYFHIALMHGLSGPLVAAEMHGRILQSGLYDASDEISVSILSKDPSLAQYVKALLLDMHPKYKVRHFSQNLNEYEWPTLRMIEEDCSSGDDLVWYMHTKGVSNSHLGIDPYLRKNVINWRGVMSHYTMDHVRVIQMLSSGEYSAVGPFYQSEVVNLTGMRMFSGNFWWATSEHIRALPRITPELSAMRNAAEEYIGTGSGAMGTLVDTSKDLYDFKREHTNEGGPLSKERGAT